NHCIELANSACKEVNVTYNHNKVIVINNAVIGFLNGPNKVDGHFGTDPVYGILSTNSRAMMQEMHSMMQGMNGSMSNTGQNNTIKMSAKEVEEVYRWSTGGGMNPIRKLHE